MTKTKNKRTFWLGFDRLLSQSLLKQMGILTLVLIMLLGFSYLSLSWSGHDWDQFCDDEGISKWVLPLYLLIDSNALNNLYMGHDGTSVDGWILFASSVTFLLGAFIFNGIIIGIITNSIERRVTNHQGGYIHYLKTGHHVIMGYDDMVPSIITHIFDMDGEAYVLILTSAEAMEIREKLTKTFPERIMKRIIVNYGHRISTEAFRDIHLEGAEQVFVVGNHLKAAHDAINVECMDSICCYLKQPKIIDRPRRITCVFKDIDTYAAFKTSEIFRDVEALGVEFVPYNFFTGWAKQVFVKRQCKGYDYPAVYGKGITPDEDRYVHLVFVGTTNFSVAFAMEAAHVLHFPNADKARTKVTFIDINADKEKDEFITRNRHFFEIQSYTYKDMSNGTEKEKEGLRDEYVCFTGDNRDFLDVEFEFIKGNVFSKQVQDEIARWAKEHGECQYLSLFLAMEDQRLNFAMGMNMPNIVYDNGVPVFIHQDRSDNFVTDLRNADSRIKDDMLSYTRIKDQGEPDSQKRQGRYANIYPFGMNETAFSADDHSLKRAKLINYLYCTMPSGNNFQDIAVLESMTDEELWNTANQKWWGLSVALKWSNLYNSYTIRTKLATLRAMRHLDIDDISHDYDALTESEVEAMARVEHNRWNVEKLLMGYRKAQADEDKYEHPKYGDTLKMNKKLFIHHDIRPYDQLDNIRDLDKEFSRYIPWIMKTTEK